MTKADSPVILWCCRPMGSASRCVRASYFPPTPSNPTCQSIAMFPTHRPTKATSSGQKILLAEYHSGSGKRTITKQPRSQRAINKKKGANEGREQSINPRAPKGRQRTRAARHCRWKALWSMCAGMWRKREKTLHGGRGARLAYTRLAAAAGIPHRVALEASVSPSHTQAPFTHIRRTRGQDSAWKGDRWSHGRQQRGSQVKIG